MAKVAIIYWTGTGNTEEMANIVSERLQAKDETVSMFSVDEIEAAEAAEYDKIALGCPAMGDEVLEEDEFQPFYDELKPLLKDKPLIIFGSYSWNEGEWMVKWNEDCKEAGLNLVAAGVACYEAPDESEEIEALNAIADALAEA